MGDVLRLHRGVDRHAGQVARFQRAGVVGDPKALLEQPIQLVADPAAPVGQARALVRKGVLEELLAGEVLEMGIIDPALAHALVGQTKHVLGTPKNACANRKLWDSPKPLSCKTGYFLRQKNRVASKR